MNTIDGRAIAQQIRDDLKQKISALINKPGLGVILVGENPASHLYVRLKEKACQEVGIYFEKYIFPANTPEEQIIQTIQQFNNSTSINGILIQLPLPAEFNTNKIILAMDPKKDADGFHPENIRLLKEGRPRIEPVLAKTIWQMIETALKRLNYKTIEKLSCLIIGNSDAFTEPLEAFLRRKNLKASHIHPQQLNREILKQFDVIIVAVGQSDFLRGEYFKNDAVVIDVGINKLPDGKIAGDVNFESTKNKTGWITPVPGGVGPVTVAMLLENIYLLAQKQI